MRRMTSPRTNAFGQPIGPDLPGWVAPPAPTRTPLRGRYCRVVPLEPQHADALYDAVALDEDDRYWTYLPYGPFATREEFHAWIAEVSRLDDPLVFAIVSADDDAPIGLCAYLRIMPGAGSIEVGHLYFSRRLRRTPAATEAMYLMMRHAFDMGYRRYEWKADAFNAPSRDAALRLGFTFEGIFRQATVYKGRSRDTAWFSVIDREWPRLERAFTTWLDPANFDDGGHQRIALRDLTRADALDAR